MSYKKIIKDTNFYDESISIEIFGKYAKFFDDNDDEEELAAE